jgi:hypothetical protein
MNLEVAQGKHESVTTSPETPTATSPETADDTVSDDSGIWNDVMPHLALLHGHIDNGIDK